MDTPKSLFSSKRERRLWLWALVVLAVIYSSLGWAQQLAGALRDQGLISGAFWVGLYLIGGAVLVQGLKARPRGLEIGVGLGIAGAYLIALLRMTVPEERSHLIEYSVVALLIHEALNERAGNGRSVPRPALLAFLLTAALGWLDEGIQLFLPNRYYDIRDVGFNAVAAFMAIGGNLALTWARRMVKKRRGG